MDGIRKTQEKMYNASKIVEDLFISLAEKDNFVCIRANKYEDRKEHWDIKLIKEGKIGLVDVKGNKDVHKLGYTWVELQTVDGYEGWLYGKANAIVLERDDRFDFIDIKKLRKLIDDNIVDKHELVFWKPDDLTELQYRRFRRLGRFDIMILTPLKDIDKLIIKTLYK